jgi:hypothetical protein
MADRSIAQNLCEKKTVYAPLPTGSIIMNTAVDVGMARYHFARSLAIPFIFVVSIIVSFFSVRAAILCWFLMFGVDAVLWRLQKRYCWL